MISAKPNKDLKKPFSFAIMSLAGSFRKSMEKALLLSFLLVQLGCGASTAERDKDGRDGVSSDLWGFEMGLDSDAVVDIVSNRDALENDLSWKKPCESPTDCETSACVSLGGEKVCAPECLSTPCPAGLRCELIRIGGDPMWICLPPARYLCRPCTNNAECGPPLVAHGNLCVPFGAIGSFCGQDCPPCPANYECVEVWLSGQVFHQCLPQSGVCSCEEEFVLDGAWTTCFRENEYGRCEGVRRCLAEGLSECSAKEPEAEMCNDKDDDCDGFTDEEGADGCTIFYRDDDNDGFGTDEAKCLCQRQGSFSAVVSKDCDDKDPLVSPAQNEVCFDFVDNDCDGLTDEEGAQGCMVFYKDKDKDGYGVTWDKRCLCSEVEDYTALLPGDCDDNSGLVSPAGEEVCFDSIDNDCDSLTDEEGALGCVVFYYDGDQDGYGLQGLSKCLCLPEAPYTATLHNDCNDNDPTVNPEMIEVCNEKDDDCDGDANEVGALGCSIFYEDKDGDGYGVGDGVCLCHEKGFFRARATGDCDDENPNVNPGQKEDCSTFEDDNCNPFDDEAIGCVYYYYDKDGDGYGTSISACLCEPSGFFTAPVAGDCDDNDAKVNPSKAEMCNGKDDDCDGETDEYLPEAPSDCTIFYWDEDGDGYGVSPWKCMCYPENEFRATVSHDCDDKNANVFPNALEVCDGLDNNCNGYTDEGFDNFPNQWPGKFGPDPRNPWRYPEMGFATVYEPLVPSWDVDFFSIEVKENNFPECKPINCKVTVSNIPSGSIYRVCACFSDVFECDLSLGQWQCAENEPNQNVSVTVVLPENTPQHPCTDSGGNDIIDGGYCDIRVSRVSGPYSCTPYELNWIVWE